MIDTIVKETLNHARRQNFWVTLRQQLQEDDGRVRSLLLAARDEAELGEAISVIRCFDVIVWMIGKRYRSIRTLGSS